MIKRIISFILSIFSVLSIFPGSAVKNVNIDKFSIIDNAKLVGEMNGENGATIEIVFEQATKFDTVVIEENGNNISDFFIEVKNVNGQYEKAYRQDKIGKYRYCDISEHTSDSIRITVNSTLNNSFKLKKIDVLNVENNNNIDFRVTTYIVCPTFYSDGKFETEKLNSITDVILFGIARFDENGQVYLQDSYINGETVPGDKVFKEIIEGVRKVNPQIRIHCNALGPDGTDADNKELLHSQAFVDNGDKLSTNIIDLIKKYGFDGFFFDYEYPYKAISRKDFSEFLVKLDKKMDGYILGAALSHWNCDLSKKAIKALDRVEIMAYDDMNGKTHSDFDSAGGGLSMLEFEKKGYDLSKCDLGLPFYGRTHNGIEAWPSYAQIVPDLNDDINLNIIQKSYLNGETNGSVCTSFNGVQMIKDKTAFAHDYGVGGVFSWHYSCDVSYDSEMSLFRAIQTTLNSRKS